MDLTSLYTPAELAETQRGFLLKILSFYKNIQDPTKCAAVVGHKLHGTGGNLGLMDLSDQGARLQTLAEEKSDLDKIIGMLKTVRIQLQRTLEQI